MRSVFEDLVLPSPQVKQFDVDVALGCSHEIEGRVERLQMLAVEADYASGSQATLHFLEDVLEVVVAQHHQVGI
jgi:hypothetical protein